MTDDNVEEPLLLRMLPEQVSQYWDRIAPLIEKSMPPTVTHRRLRMSNVLRAILMDELVVWVYIDENRNDRYVATTTIWEDPITLGKDLMIYTFTSIGQARPQDVENGLEKLKIYARGEDCGMILAYTANPQVSRFFESLGGSTDYDLLQMRL